MEYFVKCFICNSGWVNCGHRETELRGWWESLGDEGRSAIADIAGFHTPEITHKRDMTVRQDSPPVTTPEPTAALHAQRGLGKIRGLRDGPKVQKAYATGPADIQRDELVEMVERGYGDIPQTEIPANWREVPGPRAYARSKW